MIGSEKTTLIWRKINKCILLCRAKVTSVFTILQLFQAHSALRCVVMGANTRRYSRTQNEIIASKLELSVKTLNTSVFLRSSMLLHYIIAVHFEICMFALERGIPIYVTPLNILIISAIRYLVIPFTISAWSGTRPLLRALEAERNSVRS